MFLSEADLLLILVVRDRKFCRTYSEQSVKADLAGNAEAISIVKRYNRNVLSPPLLF